MNHSIEFVNNEDSSIHTDVEKIWDTLKSEVKHKAEKVNMMICICSNFYTDKCIEDVDEMKQGQYF